MAAARGRRRSPAASSRYIAFLRAINVGDRVVKMEALRRHFVRLGFTNVETFIASGNVIFDSVDASAAELEARIASELEHRLGYAVATFVRTPDEIAAIVRRRPFDPASFDYEQHALYIGFLAGPPSAAAARDVAGLRTVVDELRIAGRELYWGCRTRFSETAISGAVLERTLGVPLTLRNVTTVRRLAAKYANTGVR
jgi:uncharacterized protein (DUF1697 family)